jgi:hypothetical protein
MVLEAQPKRVRDFWLCDLDPGGLRILREIADANKAKGRRIEIVDGDFNLTVDAILASGRIKEKTASLSHCIPANNPANQPVRAVCLGSCYSTKKSSSAAVVPKVSKSRGFIQR